MAKLTIIGTDKPRLGKEEKYSISMYGDWLHLSKNPFITPMKAPKTIWHIMVQTKTGWRRAEKNKEGLIVPYTFNQKSLMHKGIKIVVEQGENRGELIVHPQRAKEPKITKVELLDGNYKPLPKGKQISYKDTIIARAHCVEMFKMNVAFTLWEDDAQGEGHDPIKNALNKINLIPVLKPVNEKGIAEAVFRLPAYTMAVQIANARIAAGDKNEGKTHEYYVTADIVNTKIQKASPNVNVTNPTYNPEPPKRQRTLPQNTPPQKPKPASPPAEKPKPKPDSPKFPVTSNGKSNTDREGKILSAEFVDTNGNRLNSSKVGKTVIMKITAKDLINKKVKVIIWEEDNFTWTNDEIYNKDWILTGDVNFIGVSLTKKMFDKANDGGGDSQRQQYFIEVIYNESSVKSSVMPITLDAEPTKIPKGKSDTVIKKAPKQKFEKVVGLGIEAIIYVTNEIASEIKVDKDGKIISYPDYGVYNGIKEYKEGEKIYCKTTTRKNRKGKIMTISVFPTFKAYIYRGKKIGEALQKLKQDIENKTYENAETTILEVARHSGEQNKNTLTQGGPIPSSSINKMFRIRYKTATNHAGKVSYRYRIVDDVAANFTVVKDVKSEVSSGSMSIGNRSSISIDPWISQALIGCLGIRATGGGNHSSCAKEMEDQSASNYKNIYHSLNNYLESVIPELTGVYGRRGYSSTGKINVLASEYDKETKVYVLIDPLPELGKDCQCNLKKDGREDFYEEFGTSAINAVKTKSSANKFKGLYMVAQRRQENGLKRNVPNNNPMNIKSSGDLGKSDLYTREVINGKEIYINDGFGKFSTIEKGFEGYLSLLQKNYVSAYEALTNDVKTISDFTTGLQLKGKYGAYATDPTYISGIQTIFKGVVSDYKKILECKLCKEKNDTIKNEIRKDIELLNKLK